MGVSIQKIMYLINRYLPCLICIIKDEVHKLLIKFYALSNGEI